MRLRVTVMGLALAASTSAAEAQGVPRLAVSLEAGSGSHTMRSGETYFRDGLTEMALAAATVRVARLGRFAPVARLETALSTGFAMTDDCRFAPNGSCREHFPRSRGTGLMVGLYGSVTGWLSAGALAGQQWHGGASKNIVDARVVLSPFRYVAATAAIRRITWDHPEHGSLWHLPVTFGLQLQLP